MNRLSVVFNSLRLTLRRLEHSWEFMERTGRNGIDRATNGNERHDNVCQFRHRVTIASDRVWTLVGIQKHEMLEGGMKEGQGHGSTGGRKRTTKDGDSQVSLQSRCLHRGIAATAAGKRVETSVPYTEHVTLAAATHDRFRQALPGPARPDRPTSCDLSIDTELLAALSRQ
jgi:hypothetical protein